MPTERVAPAKGARASLRLDHGVLVNRVFAVMVFCGSIAIVEPSPYDFVSVFAIGLWLVGGFKLHPVALFFSGLILLYNLGGFISLLPHLDEPLPTMFMLQSLYLAVTAVFFVLFFGEDTQRRAEIGLKAFALSTVVAGCCGILGYFFPESIGALFTLNGRASGTFKDPNVLGSYLIMGALFFLQTLLNGSAKRPALTVVAFALVVAGIFLSFSRGSWLAFAVATLLLVGLTIATAPTPQDRRRATAISAGTAAIGTAIVGMLLAIPDVREFFLLRFALTQDYDAGETGRFGNQLRSLGMLLDRFNGFGPLRFRLTFGLDPHNSYINAFASYGWFGATAFFLLVGLTLFVGFRLAIVASPYRRLAQVYWPALFVFLLQGMQIDIDHWRHVYLMLGAVWGLEVARQRWMAKQFAAAPRAQAARREPTGALATTSR